MSEKTERLLDEAYARNRPLTRKELSTRVQALERRIQAARRCLFKLSWVPGPDNSAAWRGCVEALGGFETQPTDHLIDEAEKE